MAFLHVLPVESVFAASTAITADPHARGGQWGRRPSYLLLEVSIGPVSRVGHFPLAAPGPVISLKAHRIYQWGVRDRSDLHLIILQADR